MELKRNDAAYRAKAVRASMAAHVAMAMAMYPMVKGLLISAN